MTSSSHAFIHLSSHLFLYIPGIHGGGTTAANASHHPFLLEALHLHQPGEDGRLHGDVRICCSVRAVPLLLDRLYLDQLRKKSCLQQYFTCNV